MATRGLLMTTRGPPMATRGPLIALAVAAVVLGCERPAEGHEEYALDPFAESSAPFSHKTYIALADEETACVIESFEFECCALNPGEPWSARLAAKARGRASSLPLRRSSGSREGRWRCSTRGSLD